MRIRTLDLLAFGPFRDKTLRFDSSGVEVVFGPNEAGKSTTRRAVLGLLHGIPERSKDGHSVADEVRIGATLSDERGRLLAIVRRKGRKNTLLTPGGEPVDEQVLAGWLGGVDAETFELTYGLDHERLRRGGDSLKIGKGELGESLFSAATGLTGLHGVLVALRAEADEIFLPRGKRPLNEAQRAYVEARKLAGQLATSPDKWLSQQKQIDDTRVELERLQAQRAALVEERAAALAIASAARAREASRARLAEIDHALSIARVELEALAPSTELLARTQAIADLQERLGSHRKAQQDRPRLAAELESIEERGRKAQREAPKDATGDRPPEAHVRKLALDAASLRERRRQLEAREASAATNVARAEERIAQLGTDGLAIDLRDALDLAQREGNLDARVATARVAAQLARREADARITALGSFEGTIDALLLLAVPSTDVVLAHRQKTNAIAERLQSMGERRRKLSEDRADAERALATLRAEGDVPTEDALARARAERDRLWDVVRESAGPPARADAAKLERAMRTADDVADRLRREASRVTRAIELEASLQSSTRKLEIATNEEQALGAENAAADAAWKGIWEESRIAPRSPDEMIAWLARCETACGAAERALVAERAVTPLVAAADAAHAALVAALAKEGETHDEALPLARLEQVAKRVIVARDKAATAREAAEGAHETAENERDHVARDGESFARDHAEWEAQWTHATLALGIRVTATPEEATAALEALTAVSRIETEADEKRRRLAGIDRDAVSFTNDVRAICDACAADLTGRAAEEACVELARRVTREKEQDARRAALGEQAHRLDAQARDARAALERADAALTSREPSQIAEARAADLDVRITDLNDAIPQTNRLLGSIETGAKAFDRSPAIAQAAEAQFQLARVRDLTERFARARLAAVAVTRLLERYRRENQGPVLERASALFTTLTLGGFQGLEVAFGEHDEPVLVAVREGKRLEMSALSEGTRDQLYLALRVASLERLTDARGPLPLLLDDVLIHFDDQRAAAALGVLAELAKKTQVILFTHHARIVEIAKRGISDRDGAPTAGIHDLGSRAE